MKTRSTMPIKGVVIIAAAGNENRNAASYPARYPHVIWLRSPLGKSPYSNFGAGWISPLLVAVQQVKFCKKPLIRNRGSGVSWLPGTSMAAPHVAGVAALVKAEGITEPDEVFSVLMKSARVFQDDTLNHFGAGHLMQLGRKLAAQGQISFKDFFRWLRENGYLNLRFWFDGGAIALLPKIAMVLGSYLLVFAGLPVRLDLVFASGLIAGSSGLFFPKGFYILTFPVAFRVLGSSIRNWVMRLMVILL